MMVEGAMSTGAGFILLSSKSKTELTGIGYTIFMIAMACMRFTADRLSNRFGLRRMLQFSGLVAAIGLILVVFIHCY